MKKRLELAKELLKDDGVIFISIDDNEQAYLKILMDEIFGEENFIASLARETKTGGGRFGKNIIQKDFDYILVYSKNLSLINEFNKKSSDWDDYKFEDDRGNYALKHPLDGGAGNKNYIQEIYIDGKKYVPRKGKNWSFCNERIEFMIKNNFLVPKSNGIVYVKNYKNWEIIDSFDNNYEIINKENGIQWSSTKFIDKEYNNASGSKKFREIFSNIDFNDQNNKDFNNPKPVSLIRDLISMIKNKDAIVLDFFAGSGTTAQAVMELNQEDGGNRRFIVITNNENNIATDICRERIYRVINGVGSNKEEIKWEYSDDIKSLHNNHVKYLRIEPIHKYDGEFEQINAMKDLYKNEFNVNDLNIKDFEK